MKSERMKNKITIQSKIITQDEELNPIETWVDLVTVWVEVLSQNSREYYRLATLNSEIEKAFKIRYIDGITPHMRALFKTKTFEIIGVENVEERNTELIIICKGVI